MNLLDAKGFWKQLKFFVLDIIQKIRKSFFTMIGMGLYIFLSICVSVVMGHYMPEVPNVFFRVLLALFQVLTCMYLAVVKWFSTFRLPIVVLCAGGAWVSFQSDGNCNCKSYLRRSVSNLRVDPGTLDCKFQQVHVARRDIARRKGCCGKVQFVNAVDQAYYFVLKSSSIFTLLSQPVKNASLHISD